MMRLDLGLNLTQKIKLCGSAVAEVLVEGVDTDTKIQDKMLVEGVLGFWS